MFLVIDNYDSFVHNLARYLALAGVEYEVVRNDAITVDEIKKRKFKGIILSPGPCTPEDAGICIETVKHLGNTTPILGVCLGHQAIGEAYGGKTIQDEKPTHGKASQIEHNKDALFKGLPNPLNVGRYHSLITELSDNSELEVTASLDDTIIMAMQHKNHPVYGVQFHPESILTEGGLDIMKNFVTLAQQWNAKKEVA